MLADIVLNSASGLAVMDERGRLLYANPAAEVIIGGEHSDLQRLLSSLAKKTAPKRKHASPLNRAGDNIREIVRPDGSRVCIRFHCSGVSNRASLVTIEDITRVAQDADRFRNAFRRAANPILWVDSDAGIIVNCNIAASRMFKRTSASMIGQPSSIIFSPADTTNPDTMLSLNGDSETAAVWEATIVTSGGNSVPVIISLSNIIESGPHPRLVQLMLRDDTERKYAYQALRESEEHFRQLSDQSPNMIFINSEGRIVYANRKCEEIMGYSRTEFYADYFNFMDLIATDSREEVAKNFSKHMRGKNVPPLEYRLQTKDGRILDSVISSRLITHKGHRAILGIVTDISDIRHAQRQLEESAVQLEQKNIALSQILTRIEEEKLEIAHRVTSNAERTLLPSLRQLRNGASPSQLRHIDLLERSVHHLTSQFGSTPDAALAILSPKELDICNRIRSGMSNKDIAEAFGVSLRTIETHRNNIRKKLDISNKKVNLASHLHLLG